MQRFLHSFAIAVLMLVASVSANAAVNILDVKGWFESGYVTWTPAAGQTYSVYVRPEGGSYTQLDNELVRNYGSYLRADAVGLKAGNYQFKVVASNGDVVETSAFTASAHDRNGFAHAGWSDGIGAYKNDGTLKDNARVIYLTANNAKTVKCMVMGDKDVEYTGIQAILAAYEKGKETRPLDIRIVGTVKKADLDAVGSSAEGLQVKGKSGSNPMNITIEGIGNDATVHGFGFLVRSACSVEFRNFAIMICMDDCISLDTDNKHCWVHNMDFFYGGTGSAADQAKGDGTVDIKGKSSHVTVSYNHFFDSGKCSLGGMKSETTDCWMTYHHNWFDHSDSRHPRIRTAFYHVYNNYFDGNAKYGVGCTSGGSAFVESNYFRNCKYPMLASKQGTDAEGDGTFSGENGGVIKAYDNKIINAKKVQYWSADVQAAGTWDAVQAESRAESVSATAYTGGTGYNSAADAAARQAVPESAIDVTADVALICRGEYTGREGLGAGRIDGGDFKWTFLYSVQDANYDVITDLKQELLNYKSTLVGFADGTAINNGGASETVDGGDGKGKTQAIDEKTPAPSWGADVVDVDQKIFIGGQDGDFYWFNEANDAQTKAYNAAGNITWDETSSYGADKFATSSDAAFSDPYVGAIALKSASGYATFYCPDNISSISLRATRAGSAKGDILVSSDGVNFSKVNAYEYAKKGTYTMSFAFSDEVQFVRVTNTSGGTLFVHGVKVFTPGEEEADTRVASDLAVAEASKSLSIGETYNISYTSSSTGAVTFTSSKKSVASVDADGKVSALAEGTTTITVYQAGDDTYKSGTKTVNISVSDPRAASSFALTSAAEVSLKEGATSQIAISGAAGAVTYASSKSSVATVSADGLITAVAAGSAVITITDAGSSSVKAGSAAVNVSVTKDMSGKTVVTFDKPSSGKTPVSSDESLVSFGGTTTYKDASYEHDGTTYTYGVKLESATEINITPSADAKVTLIFDAASKRSLLDDNEIVSDANAEYTFSGTGGKKYTLKKKDSVNLYAVVFEFGEGGGTDPGTDPSGEDKTYILNINKMYDDAVAGTEPYSLSSGTKYLMNGQTYTQDGVFTVVSNKDRTYRLDLWGLDEASQPMTCNYGDYEAKARLEPNGASNSTGGRQMFVKVGKKGILTVGAWSTAAEARSFYVLPAENTTSYIKVDDVLASSLLTQDLTAEMAKDATYSVTLEPGLYCITQKAGIYYGYVKFAEGDSATAISNVTTTAPAGMMFTIDGRRISAPVKGQLYILNGKKFIAK